MITKTRRSQRIRGGPMATLTQEAPETVATHAPLISLEGVEKVYRTG